MQVSVSIHCSIKGGSPAANVRAAWYEAPVGDSAKIFPIRMPLLCLGISVNRQQYDIDATSCMLALLVTEAAPG